MLNRSLMAVGFGDAGAEIIADNMRSGGDLNPLVPGQKVTAIFGFCDVRQFTDTTEILQVLAQLRALTSDLGQQRLRTMTPALKSPSQCARESSARYLEPPATHSEACRPESLRLCP